MIIKKYIRKELMDKAIDLSTIGIKELAWKYEDILLVLNDLAKKSVIVIGGDVLHKDNSKISYTYDNWFYSGKESKESIEQAIKYISNYSMSTNNYYFSIVIR